MTEIPREVLADAISVAEQVNFGGYEENALLIARAFMARDKRAADKCEAVAQEFLSPEYAYPQPVGSITERFACTKCKTAILTYDELPREDKP